MTSREMFGKTVTYFSYEDEMRNVQNKTLNFYTALGGPLRARSSTVLPVTVPV